jgi:hypothetical protein
MSVGAEGSDFYYVNIPIVKVYAHDLGYMIVYKVGTVYTDTIYLPMKWFTAAGKGVFDYSYGPMFPYMTVYYKGEKFSHVRLHLNADTNDSRWGVFSQTAQLASKFEGVEDIKLKF